MRDFLLAVWHAPKSEFLALVPVFLDNLLYITIVVMILVWCWGKINAPKK